jgi:hypothetical protein
MRLIAMIVLCGCAFAGCEDKKTTLVGSGSGSGSGEGSGAAKGTVRITFVEVK